MGRHRFPARNSLPTKSAKEATFQGRSVETAALIRKERHRIYERKNAEGRSMEAFAW